MSKTRKLPGDQLLGCHAEHLTHGHLGRQKQWSATCFHQLHTYWKTQAVSRTVSYFTTWAERCRSKGDGRRGHKRKVWRKSLSWAPGLSPSKNHSLVRLRQHCRSGHSSISQQLASYIVYKDDDRITGQLRRLLELHLAQFGALCFATQIVGAPRSFSMCGLFAYQGHPTPTCHGRCHAVNNREVNFGAWPTN